MAVAVTSKVRFHFGVRKNDFHLAQNKTACMGSFLKGGTLCDGAPYRAEPRKEGTLFVPCIPSLPRDTIKPAVPDFYENLAKLALTEVA